MQSIGAQGHPLLGTGGPKGWDQTRYRHLSLPDDDASFDVFTQIIAAIRGQRMNGDVDPMGSLSVERVIATGASQSSNRLATYCNAIQHVTHALDGVQMIVYSGGG